MAQRAKYVRRPLGVSKSAVVGKIDRLKLLPPSAELRARRRRRAGRQPFWVANLLKLLGTKSNAAVGRKLGVSKAAVFRLAHRLGLLQRPRAT
jgi:hypothetical protein